MSVRRRPQACAGGAGPLPQPIPSGLRKGGAQGRGRPGGGDGSTGIELNGGGVAERAGATTTSLGRRRIEIREGWEGVVGVGGRR